MAITTVLFDLDGTLLPMDQDIFIKDYFSRIAAKMAGQGYDPKQLVDTIWHGTVAMIKNTSDRSNEAVFWELAVSVYGEKILSDKRYFDEFYETEFDKIKAVCGCNSAANEAVHKIKEQGKRIALATNPIFPARATEWRIGWAGLDINDFELVTTYENINRSKPNPEYYLEIAERLDVKPEECLMVGNDVGDDMVAEKTGMKVFLLTDCLINRKDEDISKYPQGSFKELLDYIETL
ncbi:MAG: HAD family hydrolase [Oscillospiraceae bacterium]|nr:HAD family hydrolase [Oscillospiraceae bacterium]